jgi:hypothetical protein
VESASAALKLVPDSAITQMCLTGGSLIGVPGAGFSLLLEPVEEPSEDCDPEEPSLADELSEDAGAEAGFEAALAGWLEALADGAGSLAVALAELVLALAGGLALACVISAAMARCANVAASAGEPEGFGPSAAPAIRPTTSTLAARAPTSRRDGAGPPGRPSPRATGASACAPVGNTGFQNAVKSIRGAPRLEPHCKQ